ncbi:hypothetical protein BJX76DRAFT_352951 [Aspergillus varians]
MATTHRSHTDYTIGWICALPVEMAASKAMLRDNTSTSASAPNDYNVYTLGELHDCLLVATHMLHTFPELRFTLLVGVGGGVPPPGGRDPDIRLGDIAVSKPTSTFGGVVQYDHGKAITGNRFQRTGALNKPPSILLAAISHLKADHMIGDNHIPRHLENIMARFTKRIRPYVPGSEHDNTLPRPSRSSNNPHIHYGLIASGNQVIKDALMRDRIVDDLGGAILCFEMEAAGLMNDFKCLLYAAAAAAAYAKELLSVIPVVQIQTSPNAKTEGVYLPFYYISLD